MTWALPTGSQLARGSVADDLGRAYGSDVAEERQAAVRVITEIGRRLAWALATLHAPGTATDQGWSPWRQAYLRYWATIREVGIAGGLVAGAAGPVVVAATNRVLRGTCAPVSARLVPRPEVAGMLGAARCTGVTDGTVVAVDLGHSTAKSGLVRICQGEVSDLHISRRARDWPRPWCPGAVRAAREPIGRRAPGRQGRRPGPQRKCRCRCFISCLLHGRPCPPAATHARRPQFGLLGDAGPKRGGVECQASGYVRPLLER